MGAHFGHGGTVEGETIKCPFHGFCFDTNGECTKTGYDTPPSPRVGVPKYPIKEMHGIIMAYYHPESKQPEWNIPDIETEGWSELKHITWRLRSHPQETAENAVDIGHFSEVHGYTKIKEIEPFNYDGPFVKARYSAVRPAGIIKGLSNNIGFEFEINKYGFGYSRVESFTKKYDMHTRHFVFTQPIDGDEIYLRIALSMKKVEKRGKINPMLTLLPKKLAENIILGATFKNYKADVSDDFKIWKNKKYVHPPALSKGDGPIMQYRKWAEQFYPKKEKAT